MTVIINGTTGSISLALPPGMVMYFANSTAPGGWLECNGAAVSRLTYADLFDAIGTVYGSGDGASTFNLPDLRGQFVRGWNNNASVDPGRAIGSSQASQMQEHSHISGLAATGTIGQFYDSSNTGLPAQVTVGPGSTPTSASPNTSSVGGSSNSSETRPRNVAMMACIKF